MRIATLWIFCLTIWMSASAAAWSLPSLEAIALKAIEFMPENVRFITEKHRKDLTEGILESQESQANSTDSIIKICDLVTSGSSSIINQKDFKSAVRIMGRIARMVAISVHPLPATDSRVKPDNRTDYDVYLEKNRSFFRVRWTGIEQRPRNRDQLAHALNRSIVKTSALAETLITTLAENSIPISQYDHQSIPFGAGSIAFSNAVSQTANAWLLLWQNAGGLNSAFR